MNSRDVGGFERGFASELDVATIMVARSEHIFYFDRSAEDLTGFQAAEIIGRDIHVLTGPGESLVGPGQWDEAGMIRSGTVPILRADGTTRSAMIRSHHVRLHDGESAMVIQLADVGESLRLRSHLGLLDAFYHQAPFGFAVLDEHLRYVMVNDALAEINDFSAEEHVGRHVREIIGSVDFEQYEKVLRGVLETGKPVIDAVVPRYSRNQPGRSSVSSASWFRVCGLGGLSMAICGIIYDVTQSRQDTLTDAVVRDRLRLLAKVGALQGKSLDVAHAARDLAELLTEDFCEIATIDALPEVVGGARDVPYAGGPSQLHRIAVSNRIDGPHTSRLAGGLGPVPSQDIPVIASVVATHRSVLHRKGKEPPFNRPLPDWVMEAARGAGVNSFVGVPLIAHDTVVGVLRCIRAGNRSPFDENDLDLVETIAARMALSIDNARLYNEEKETALILQMSLLPHDLPSADEVEVVYRYLPGEAGRRVGGDWYDVNVLPGHRIALTLGDVTGHGIAAAASMGRYRSVVHALSMQGLDPATLMTRLNDIAGTFGSEVMATCLYISYDPWRHRCTLVSAGHPPLIVQLPGESPRLVEERNGPLLGSSEGVIYSSITVDTPPGTRLLLLSDGLVESRETDIDTGFHRVLRKLRGGRIPLPQLADRIMASAPDDAKDDRTLLLAELRGLPVART